MNQKQFINYIKAIYYCSIKMEKKIYQQFISSLKKIDTNEDFQLNIIPKRLPQLPNEYEHKNSTMLNYNLSSTVKPERQSQKQEKNNRNIFKDRITKIEKKTQDYKQQQKRKNKSILQQIQEVRRKQKESAMGFVKKVEQKKQKTKLKNIQRYKMVQKVDQEKQLTKRQKDKLVQQKIKKQYAFLFKQKKPEGSIKIQPEKISKYFQDDNTNKKFYHNKQDLKIADLGYIHFQRNNYSSFVRVLLSHQFAEQLLQPQVKKVPNVFPQKQSYIKIFQFLIINQAIAALHNNFRNYKYTQKYSRPSKIKMKISKQTDEGFIIFQLQQIDIKQNNSFSPVRNLSLSKFNLILLSNQPNFSLKNFSNVQFRRNFLFMGCLVTPQNKDQLVANIRVLTHIDSKNFLRQHGKQWQEAYVFQFQKISTFIRQFLAIRNVQFQDIAQFIYSPPLMENYLHNYISHPQIFKKYFDRIQSLFNSTQLNSIKELSLRDKGIIMLQGPPGTGKTSTLLGVLAGQYHYLKHKQELSKTKILVCTPSNTAIDHIVKRIIKQGLITQKQVNIKPKILRIGLLDSNDQIVRSVYLDYLCQTQLLNEMKELENNMKLTIPQIKQKITQLSKQIKRLQYNNQINRNKQTTQKIKIKIFQRQQYQKQAYQLRKQRIDAKSKYHQIQKRILNQAQIICTTLSSTGSDRLEKYTGKFSCLIVDEAGQCTQPNLAIPLKLNIKKVLLIGDPCQLPATTFSPDSNITLYNRSMFERMIDAGLKPYFLDIQYRMCPQIRQFPSKYFYKNRLQDANSVKIRSYPKQINNFVHKNVIFIDTKFGIQSLIDKSYQNQAECLVVKSLCQLLDIQNLDVGIITPYKQQMRKISQYLKGHNRIFVNTIDSFQGQQKDIIIISTVRANHSRQKGKTSMGFLTDQRRINVALTRSKFLLIVIGHADTLGSNQIWNSFLDYIVQKKCYFKLESRQNFISGLKRLINDQTIQEDSICKRVKHKYLSRDLRKVQRQDIQLEDFIQQGEIKVNIEKNDEIIREEIESQKKSIQSGKMNGIVKNDEIWNVQAAINRTEIQLRKKYGQKSILDLIFM